MPVTHPTLREQFEAWTRRPPESQAVIFEDFYINEQWRAAQWAYALALDRAVEAARRAAPTYDTDPIEVPGDKYLRGKIIAATEALKEQK